jgi:hypothetical protein
MITIFDSNRSTLYSHGPRFFAFYYFEAIGSDDVPVFEFDYDHGDVARPRRYTRDVPEFFADRIRAYLQN